MPGGVEEWSKEDVLDIVVGKADQKIPHLGYQGVGTINETKCADDYTESPQDAILEGPPLKPDSFKSQTAV